MTSTLNHPSASDLPEPNKIPLWLKLLFTAFMAVLVPNYWRNYGPTNFLYFCDVSLFLTLLALWTEKPIFASMACVGILLPQLLWMVDFLLLLVNVKFAGLTAYMFDEKNPPFNRSLSFFHFWLPILLVWIVWRLGYDRRAVRHWTPLAWVLMLTSFFFIPAARAAGDSPNLPVNVNYVYGLGAAPQTWMPAWAWLVVLLIGMPALIYWPTHLLLHRFAPTSK
jgi:hypothetical protein